MKTRRTRISPRKAASTVCSIAQGTSPVRVEPAAPAVILLVKAAALEYATEDSYSLLQQQSQGLHAAASGMASAQSAAPKATSPEPVCGRSRVSPPTPSAGVNVSGTDKEQAPAAIFRATTSCTARAPLSGSPPHFLHQVGPRSETVAGGVGPSPRAVSHDDAGVSTTAPIGIFQRLYAHSEHIFDRAPATDICAFALKSVSVEEGSVAVPTPGLLCAESTSPVHLTELVAVNTSKMRTSPPSDRNHNLTPPYENPHLSPVCTLPSYRADGPGHDPVYKKYYSTVAEQIVDYPEKTLAVLENVSLATTPDGGDGRSSASSPSCYQADCPGLAWSTYSAPPPSSTSYSYRGDASSEYSSPEALQPSCPGSVNAPSAVSPTRLAASTASRWCSHDDGAISGMATYPTHSRPASGTYPAGSACTTPGAAVSTGGDRSSTTGSSVGAYFSEDSDGSSMREIQQEILRADIERHIYENYANHIPSSAYPPEDDEDADPETDDDDDEDTENEICPTKGSGKRKAGSPSSSSSSSAGTSKKRRRRTQTPIQRRAANMRERKRMCHLNVAFDALKNRLPNVRNRKKLSRIQTLKAAIFYIGLLAECVQSA